MRTSSKSSSPKSSSGKVAKKRRTAVGKTAAKRAGKSSTKRPPKAVVTYSRIHGRGVVAGRDLVAGERVCEYKGDRIGWPEALRRHPHDPAQPFHTFYFTIDDDTVIDGNANGNIARWINHSCAPNCEADMVEVAGETRIFISALRDIPAGTELVYNYGLSLDERYTPTLKKQFECRCGAKACSGTMLAPKR
jgi:uncharacterized protein